MLDIDLTGGPEDEKDDTYLTKHAFPVVVGDRSRLLLRFFYARRTYPPLYPPAISMYPQGVYPPVHPHVPLLAVNTRT
jgi:hypothetical protein